MMNRRLWLALLAAFSLQTVWAASDLAPAVPELSLPSEAEPAAAAFQGARQPASPALKQASAPQKTAVKKTAAPKPAPKKAAPRKARASSVPPVTNAAAKVNAEEIVVENLMPQNVNPAPATSLAQAAPAAQSRAAAAPQAQRAVAVPVPADGAENQFVPARETAPAAQQSNALLVSYNPPTDRDPTLSPDDTLLLRHREEERLRQLELERQRKLEAERRRLAEIERQRQLELERLRDPSREIRGKIRVNGIIGQEVFIGSKVYTVGKTVLGARIVSVHPDSVVFMYKGQKFTKKVQLQ